MEGLEAIKFYMDNEERSGQSLESHRRDVFFCLTAIDARLTAIEQQLAQTKDDGK